MVRFLNYIGSRRFAIYLLVVTVFIILASNLLPRVDIMEDEERQRLERERPVLYRAATYLVVGRVVRSPYFQVIPVFIFLSISVCTVRRIRTEIGRQDGAIPSNLPVQHSLDFMEDVVSKEYLATRLRERGWSVSEPGAGGTIYGRKGEAGIWGSFCFHAGMNVVLLGILVSATTAVNGALHLTEGFPLRTPESIMGIRGVGDFPFKEMILESFVPVIVRKEFPVEYICRVAGTDKRGRLRRYKFGVNDPLEADGYKFIFGESSYAPRFVLRDKDGAVVADTVANLLIFKPGAADSFEIPGEGLRFKVEIFPDFYNDDGKIGTRTLLPNNPVLFVDVEKGGKVIGRGFLPKDKAVNFADYSLEFTELRYWVKIIVSKDAGMGIIILGFFLITAGLFLRFILNERRLWIIIKRNEKGETLGLGGSARLFPTFFEEELRRLAEEISLQIQTISKESN